jgi:hypothetical protein
MGHGHGQVWEALREAGKFQFSNRQKGNLVAKAILVGGLIVFGIWVFGSSNDRDTSKLDTQPVTSQSSDIMPNELISEGITVSKSLAAVSGKAARVAQSGDFLGACEYYPEMQAKTDRLAEIVDELGELAEPYGLPKKSRDLQAQMDQLATFCA